MSVMSVTTATHPRHYIMRDQVPSKVRAIMDECRTDPNTGGHSSTSDPGPMLSRPGWVAITLLVIAFNLMAVLPPAA